MQTTSWSCWFGIVSTRIAVLPVERSPMISSRWPRPTFVIESIALMPVWSGSFTGWRSTTPRALHSSGRVADRDARDLAGPLHRLALGHVLPLAEERGADVVLLEVERKPDDPVLELEHLQGDGVLEPVDAGDPVADLQHRAGLSGVRLDVELLDPLFQDRRDLFRAQLQRFSSLSSCQLSA